MAFQDDVNKAIAAHGMWKARLRTAIDTGKSDFAVAQVRLDNACDFGKWLSGPAVTAEVRQSERFKQVQRLHAEFHKTTAEVLALALAGKKADAEKALAPGTPFAKLSGELTMAMMAWGSEKK